MVKKNIVFVAFDDEYVATIEYKFSKLIEEQATVEFITERTQFKRLLSLPKRIDVLIVPEEVTLEHPEVFSKTKVYYLTDEERKSDDSSCIYKYFSVKRIVEKIDLGLLTEGTKAGAKGTRVIGVYSASGGTGKTLASLALSCRLKQKGKRVLYVSTVPHQDFSYYLENQEVLGTAFCYQCSINIKNALKIVQGEIRNEDFDFLPPFKNLPVSYQMKFSTYVQIIKYLKEKNLYDYIVVEISSDLELEKTVFLKECDKMVVITTQDRVAVGKLETFLTNMLEDNQNLILLCNRYKPNQMDFLSSKESLRKYEFSEFIEEYADTLDWKAIKASSLFERTAVCVE